MEHKLDNIDRKIIEMLQKNARTPVKEIAKEVFPLIPRCLRQDRTPRKKRLITGYHARSTQYFSVII